jgi:hypothetical protein
MVLPPKQDEEVKDKKAEPLQVGADIKQVIRGINVHGQVGPDGSEPVDVVNDYLRSYFAQGYQLFHVQHLRSNQAPEGGVISEQMLYVLYKAA